MRPIGVQLYSVRNQLGADFDRTVAKVASTGCAGVEMAGLPQGISPEHAKKLFGDLGLKVLGWHTGLVTGPDGAKIFDSVAYLRALVDAMPKKFMVE